jgi:hypothetical protein
VGNCKLQAALQRAARAAPAPAPRRQFCSAICNINTPPEEGGAGALRRTPPRPPTPPPHTHTHTHAVPKYQVVWSYNASWLYARCACAYALRLCPKALDFSQVLLRLRLRPLRRSSSSSSSSSAVRGTASCSTGLLGSRPKPLPHDPPRPTAHRPTWLAPGSKAIWSYSLH